MPHAASRRSEHRVDERRGGHDDLGRLRFALVDDFVVELIADEQILRYGALVVTRIRIGVDGEGVG